MAVAPELRGPRRRHGACSRRRSSGRGSSARPSLFLGSNSKLGSAVHLYEQFGFQHVEPETLHMPYDRANVFMRLELSPGFRRSRRRLD